MASEAEANLRCPACGAACHASAAPRLAGIGSVYSRAARYDIRECGACGHGWTDPRPSDAELAECYASTYNYPMHAATIGEKRWRARGLLAKAGGARVESLLDVGCMYGNLLEEASRRGVRRVCGVELSAAPVAEARARGLDVFEGTIESFAAQSPEPFDLVCASHVLEHIGDLDSFLAAVGALLRPGGRVLISLPNFGGRGARLLGRNWGWWQVPVHLHHFSEASLGRLLARNGLTTRGTWRRGGDALFLLLSASYLVRGPQASNATASAAQTAIVRAASLLLRPWAFVGDDELIVIAQKSAP